MISCAIRWRDTLHDLAGYHNNPEFDVLAEKINQKFIAMGIDLTPGDEEGILQASADLLKGK